jgi:hypothetical protein
MGHLFYPSINDVHDKKRDKENPGVPHTNFKRWYE